MKLRLIVVIFVALVFPNAVLAQWWNPFGPSNYEDCVLEAAKDAKTDGATRLAQAACRSKFPSKEGAMVSACHVTWNGSEFVLGRPAEADQFTQIRFPNTADRVWFPSHMNMTKAMIVSNSAKIQRLCPTLVVPKN